MLSMYVYEYENEANDPLLQKKNNSTEREQVRLHLHLS